MVEVNNLTTSKIDSEFLRKVARVVLKGENKKSIELSIALVGQKEIKKLNKKYRGKNKATDVLSFSYGEIVICPDKVRKGELARVLIHGILHLLGLDHEGTEKRALEMEKKEDYYLLKTESRKAGRR
jgi:probable rRNA maturation factor